MADKTYVQPLDRITTDPDICNGKPVVRGMRITVETVIGYLSAGESVDEILRQHPVLVREDVTACLEFAARVVGHGYEFAKTA